MCGTDFGRLQFAAGTSSEGIEGITEGLEGMARWKVRCRESQWPRIAMFDVHVESDGVWILLGEGLSTSLAHGLSAKFY